MRIAQDLYDAMIKHARDDLPNECCGLVACQGDEAAAIHPVRNIQPSAASFMMDPVQVVQVFDRVHDAGQRVGALYHSHPGIPPVPSMIDVGYSADWSGVMWIIVGNLVRYRRSILTHDAWEDHDAWEEPDEPDVWAWWIEQQRIFTAELQITEGGRTDNDAGELAIRSKGNQ